MCITVAAVPFEIRSLYVCLAGKAILENSIRNSSGPVRETVNSGWRSSPNSVIDWTIGKRKDSCRCCVSSSRALVH